jgi:HSP20 family protein
VSAGGASGAARGISAGIAGGDLEYGGVAATKHASGASTPAAGDVDAGLFGGAPGATVGSTDREREMEPARETREPGAAASAARAGAPQGRARVIGRGQPGGGLSAWIAGAENPLAMMRRMQDDLDRVLRVFGIPRLTAALAPQRELEDLLARSPAATASVQWSPQIEVFERDGNLVVHADLPAVRREDLEVDVEQDVLTIRGQRRQEHREAEGGYRRTERSYGTFLRQIPLPEGVDPNDIEATYQDGVLEVVVPTPRDADRPRRRIDIG